jgi:hypothetical protein
MRSHMRSANLFAITILSFASQQALSQISFTAPLPSTYVLQSGIVLGTGREQHLSMRVKGLGSDLSQIVDDHVTNLYRNPAYFGMQERTGVLGELIKFPSQRRSTSRISDSSAFSSAATIRESRRAHRSRRHPCTAQLGHTTASAGFGIVRSAQRAETSRDQQLSVSLIRQSLGAAIRSQSRKRQSSEHRGD